MSPNTKNDGSKTISDRKGTPALALRHTIWRSLFSKIRIKTNQMQCP